MSSSIYFNRIFFSQFGVFQDHIPMKEVNKSDMSNISDRKFPTLRKKISTT